MPRLPRPWPLGVLLLPALACPGTSAVLAAAPTNTPVVLDQERSQGTRLSVRDFKVFRADRPITGLFDLADPMTGAPRRLEIRPHPQGGGRLGGYSIPDGAEILTLSPRRQGVGYEGLLHGLFAACQMEAVPVSDLLPLGDEIVIRLDMPPPDIPCSYLEDPANVRLLVAPAEKPIPLRSKREIISERTRSEIGLEGVRGEAASPILLDSTRVEGGTELKLVDRVHGLDGAVWIEVETLVSPAPGVEPPRGFMKPSELRLAASITLRRVGDPGTSPAN